MSFANLYTSTKNTMRSIMFNFFHKCNNNTFVSKSVRFNYTYHHFHQEAGWVAGKTYPAYLVIKECKVCGKRFAYAIFDFGIERELNLNWAIAYFNEQETKL